MNFIVLIALAISRHSSAGVRARAIGELCNATAFKTSAIASGLLVAWLRQPT
jgi:hypothetical protein